MMDCPECGKIGLRNLKMHQRYCPAVVSAQNAALHNNPGVASTREDKADADVENPLDLKAALQSILSDPAIVQQAVPLLTVVVRPVVQEEMKQMAGLLPDIVSQVVDQKLTQMAMEAQRRASQEHVAVQTNPVQSGVQEQSQGTERRGPIPPELRPLVNALAQRMVSGGDSATSSLESFAKQMMAFQQMATLWQAPMVTGMKMMSDMIGAAIRAGASPEAAADAASRTVDTLIPKPVAGNA